MTDKLIVKRIPTASGGDIGILSLNKPRALNALDIDMASALLYQLTRWQDDDTIILILISGEGSKAFCAGGDIVSMYSAMQSHPNQIPDFLSGFFATEYRLDWLIHRYNKPIIAWGSGIVMGGGLGLFAGASHRIVTPSTRMAMPEITIGLYPDVGGSYFLPKVPGKTGLFLGLTGASVNATDALHCGLADFIFDDRALQPFCDALISHHWQIEHTEQQLADLCSQFKLETCNWPDAKLTHWQAKLSQYLADCRTASDAVHAILRIDHQGDSWFQCAQQTLQAGSPTTMHLVWEQYQRGMVLSLEDCFRMEMIMSCRCAESGEFAEGIRSLLIDKDKQPKWRYSSVDDVPGEVIEKHFSSPWCNHPLSDLGNP